MAKVQWATGISTVSGSLAKPVVKSGHSHGDYLIGTHRVAASENPACSRLYIRKQDTYVRTTPISTKETEARTRFAVVSAAVAARKKDLSKITQDQIDFMAQKDLPNGKKTMTAYLWKVEGDAYDESQD